MSRVRRMGLALLLCAALNLHLVRPGFAQSSPDRVAVESHRQQMFLNGLVERRMFSLAAKFCKDRVLDSSSPRARADWAGQWIGVLAEHAKQSASADRDRLWLAAARVNADFSDAEKKNPWAIAVEYQSALARLVKAELLVQPCELGMMEPDGALAELRKVLGALTTLESELSKRMRASSGASKQLDGPTLAETKALRARVLNAIGRVHLYQAQLYGKGTPDRVSAAIAAIGRFEKVSPADVPSELWDQVRLNLLAALRLKGDFTTAAAQLDRYMEADVSVPFRLRARAEQIRVAVAEGRDIRAQALIALNRVVDGRIDPELDLASLETIVHQWHNARDAKQTEAANAWREKAMERVAIIERDHSPYWLHRAEMLISTAAVSGTNDDFDVLQRTARNLYVRGRLDEAVAAYDKGSQQAETTGDRSSAFDMAFQAAAIEKKRGKFDDARNRFREAANKFPESPNASRSHELAILLAATQALEKDERSNYSQQQLLGVYEQLLLEHVSKWPSGASAQRAQLWLAKLYEFQEEFWMAANAYTRVDSDEPTEMFRKAKVCFVKALEQSTERDEKLHSVINSLRELASRSTTRRPNKVGNGDSELMVRQRIATLMAAELQLRFSKTLTEHDLVEIIESLSLLLEQQAEVGNPQWRDRAHVMCIAARVRLAQWKRAAREIDSLRNALSPTWFELLTLLAYDEISLDGSQRELGEIQLLVLAQFRQHNPSLSPEERKKLAQWRADALMRAGNFAEAQVVLKPLVAQSPNDLRLREVFARSLLHSDDPETLSAALTQWRIALKQNRPRTKGWFRAKYGIAAAYRKLGHPKRASEMIQLLKALYPSMGGDSLQPMFEKLLKECEQAMQR